MTIDVHGHITSPELLARYPMPPSLGDVEGMIEQKAEAGIITTIVGSPVGAGTMVPLPGLDNYGQPADRLAAFHDWLAETVRGHPGRLKAYAYVNPFGGDAELDAAAERLRQEEFVGLIANSSVRGEYLGPDSFFAMAAEHEAPVMVHPPAEPVGGAALGSVGLVEHVARPGDVTACVAAIILAGWLEKYPGLRLVASNAGGALALLAEKLDMAYHRAGPPGPPGGGPPGGGPPGGGPPGGGPPGGGPPGPPGPPQVTLERPPSEALRRVYVDTATPSPAALAAAAETFGPERMVFGTDSPPLSGSLTAYTDRVERLPVAEQDKERVRAGNARGLFGLERTDASQDADALGGART